MTKHYKLNKEAISQYTYILICKRDFGKQAELNRLLEELKKHETKNNSKIRV